MTCCLPSGNCEQVDIIVCLDAGGVPLPPDSGCSQCPDQQTGACCFPDGQCRQLPFLHCLQEGGQPGEPGSPCSDAGCVEPPFGACCVGSAAGVPLCIETSLPHCNAENGIFQGPGTRCTDDAGACGPMLENCCLPNGCFMVPLEACLDEGGMPLPPGVPCDHCSDVKNVACCLPDDGCLEVPLIICLRLGGDPTALGGHCADVDCSFDPMGACCLQDPAGGSQCIEAPLELCLNEGGAFQGPGTRCDDPNMPCGPPPIGICCLPDGDCALSCHSKTASTSMVCHFRRTPPATFVRRWTPVPAASRTANVYSCP